MLSPNNPYLDVVNGNEPSVVQPSSTPEPQPQGDGLVKGLVKGLAKPFVKLGVSGYNAFKGKDLTTERDLPYFGKTSGIESPVKDTGFISKDGGFQNPLSAKGLEETVGAGVNIGLTFSPALEFKALKTLPVLSTLLRGGVYGSSFMASDAMQEGKSLGTVFKEGAIGAPFGALTDLGLGFAVKGAQKVGTIAFDKAVEAIGSRWPDALSSISTRFEKNFGPVGKIVAEKLNTVDATQRQRFGRASLDMMDAGIMESPVMAGHTATQTPIMSREEAWAGENSLLDKLTGRSEDRSGRAYEVANNLRQTIKTEAESAGIKNDWQNPEVYFPHHVPEVFQVEQSARDLATHGVMGAEGSVRRDVIENAVLKDKVFKTPEEAAAVLDDWIKFVNEGGRVISGKEKVADLVASGKISDLAPGQSRSPEEKDIINKAVLKGNKWLEYLVKSGKADSLEQAAGLTMQDLKYRQDFLTKRSGSLDHAREFNFPFYDPDPRRVLPLYTFDALGRIESAKSFGANDEELQRLIGEIQQDPTLGFKKAQDFTDLFEKAIGQTTRSRSFVEWSRKIRSMNVMKLTFAQIMNLGQNLNSYLSSDLKSVGTGLRSAFTDQGIRDAVESGSLINTVMQKTLSYQGGGTEFANNWLKWTGFNKTEMFNRIVSSNSGKKYAERIFEQLQKDPQNPNLHWALDELLIDTRVALEAGKIPEQELLRAADVFTQKTQFLSRNIDLPAFMATPEGKVFGQFKTYAFQQAKYVKDELKRQLLNGNYKGLARDLVILGSIYPMTGEVLGDLQSLVTGSDPSQRGTGLPFVKDHPFLDRYLVDLMSVGTTGLWADALTSAERGNFLEFLAGPSATTASHVVEKGVQAVMSPDKTHLKAVIKEVLQATGVGRIINNTLLKSKGRRSVLDLFSRMNPLGAETANAAELPPDQLAATSKLSPIHDKIQKTMPNLPASMLDYVSFKESSNAVNDLNRNNDAGKYGWVYGITKLLEKDFAHLGIKANLNTVEGAAKASADYLAYLQKKLKLTDPKELYKAYNLGPYGYLKQKGKKTDVAVNPKIGPMFVGP